MVIDVAVMKKILEAAAKAPPPKRNLADKLIDVQPLPQPLGLIFYVKYRYGDRRESRCPDKL